MSSTACPKCGKPVRAGAKFCSQCRTPLAPPEPTSTSPNLFQELLNEGNKLLDDVAGKVGSLFPATGQKSRPKIYPKAVGDKVGRYVVLEPITLQYSNYYHVRARQCTHCQHENTDWHAMQCVKCQQPLWTYILRESELDRAARQGWETVVALSQSTALNYVVRHLDIFERDNHQYVVLEDVAHNTPQPVTKVSTPCPPISALGWCRNLTQALVELHRQGLTFQSLPPADKDDPVWRETWRESILVINQAANFGDLTLVRRMLPGEDVAGAARKDVIFLGRLFRWFLTGRAGAPTAALNIHPAFQEIVNKVNSQAYRTAQEFLEDLSRVQIADVAPKRSLRQTTGYTTSVGIVREANEDFVGRYSFAMEQKPGTPELGLYVVADGMGGHAAGELASKDVVRVVVDRIHQLQSAPALTAKTRRLTEEEEVSNPLGDTLRTAILEANGILFKSRQASRSDRGTTITSALVLGDAAVVANVGDSRTYLLRDGELKQVSNDHSLVASLVAAGMITPEQALTHPQRNQIYRTLGDKPKVDVDIFPLSLNANDTLLLCSDGLWEMVRDETIRGILMAARTPQMACDELIKAANLAGGEDNVSVIVVRLE